MEPRRYGNYIDSQNAVNTIDVNDPWLVDWHAYKERHLVERSSNGFIRYNTLDISFLAFVHITATSILLK